MQFEYYLRVRGKKGSWQFGDSPCEAERPAIGQFFDHNLSTS